MVLAFLTFVALLVAITLFAVHPLVFVLGLLPVMWFLLQLRSSVAQMERFKDVAIGNRRK